MNYNKEMMLEFKKIGFKNFKLIKIPKDKKGTYEDYLKLEKKIESYSKENEEMLYLSELYSKDSLVCGKVLTKRR